MDTRLPGMGLSSASLLWDSVASSQRAWWVFCLLVSNNDRQIERDGTNMCQSVDLTCGVILIMVCSTLCGSQSQWQSTQNDTENWTSECFDKALRRSSYLMWSPIRSVSGKLIKSLKHKKVDVCWLRAKATRRFNQRYRTKEDEYFVCS